MPAQMVHNLLDEKIDKGELVHLLGLKASKLDAETALNSVDVIHQQVRHLIVILVELL